MNASIIFDGRSRFDEAQREKRALRQAQLYQEAESRCEGLAKAGFWRRGLIRLRIRREVAAALKKEFPSAKALFVRTGEELRSSAPRR